jgi:hypothetical protein
MRKILITYCDYPDGNIKRIFYEKYTKPRFVEYCKIHDFEFIEIKQNCANPYNLGFAKVFWIKQHWDEFKNGDVISYMDIDCCIVNATKPAIFEKDFSIVQESTGVLCMGGTWSIRISDWSKLFINEMCSLERQRINKDLGSWNVWHENDAIYHVLGLNWGEPMDKMGTRNTTPFSQSLLFNYVGILPSEWGNTYNPEDVDWTQNKFALNDQNDPDWIYKIIAQYAVLERSLSIDKTIVRHLSAGTMFLPWAHKYYNKEMIK